MANIQSKCLKFVFLRNQLTDNSALGAFILKFAKPKLLSNIIKIDALKFLEYYYLFLRGMNVLSYLSSTWARARFFLSVIYLSITRVEKPIAIYYIVDKHKIMYLYTCLEIVIGIYIVTIKYIRSIILKLVNIMC